MFDSRPSLAPDLHIHYVNNVFIILNRRLLWVTFWNLFYVTNTLLHVINYWNLPCKTPVGSLTVISPLLVRFNNQLKRELINLKLFTGLNPYSAFCHLAFFKIMTYSSTLVLWCLFLQELQKMAILRHSLYKQWIRRASETLFSWIYAFYLAGCFWIVLHSFVWRNLPDYTII